MAARDEQQSSGCSACDQLGQTPTAEHLAGVARFDARQQVAPDGHRQNDEYPAFCRCLSRWPCELAADELAAENARLRERVAALEAPLELADEVSRLTTWGITVSDCREACEHPACLILRAIARYRKARAALSGQPATGGAS